jgi:hypothetical protein
MSIKTMLFYNKVENKTEKECADCRTEFESRIAELEKMVKKLDEQLNKNSRNSNKPPSSDNPFSKQTKNLRTKSGKKPGDRKDIREKRWRKAKIHTESFYIQQGNALAAEKISNRSPR